MVTFNYTKEFLRQAKRLTKRYRSLPDDINSLQHDLIENPEIGVSLGGGKRKIRLGAKSKGGGKRGGLRVVTLNIVVETTDTCVILKLAIPEIGEITTAQFTSCILIFIGSLLTGLGVYDKTEIQNVSEEYINQIIQNL